MKMDKLTNARVQKKVFGQVRRAVQDYNMIEDGDRIAVGVSGGKDSITLLVALSNLQKFYPKKFELEAITLTLGIGAPDFSAVENLCRNLGINYTIENTLIGKIVFEAQEEKNPCSLCANMRRGALHNAAKKLNCSKVALGHSRDDVIETFILSLFYEGRINTFSPVTYLSRKDIFVIRPLIYSEAKDIRGFIKSLDIKTVPSLCYINNISANGADSGAGSSADSGADSGAASSADSGTDSITDSGANSSTDSITDSGADTITVNVTDDVTDDVTDSVMNNISDIVVKGNIADSAKSIATKRDFIRSCLLELQKDVPMVKYNIFGAIKRSGINGWTDSSNKDP